MVAAVFPNGIVPWTDRVNLINTIYAADPNSLAAEIVAVEGTLGTNPHIESAPPVGNPIVYSNVSARIHDVQMGNQNPACTVSSASFTVKNPAAHPNSYNAMYDPFGLYNGTDITVPANGWYTITANQTWGWAASGWLYVRLLIGNSEVTSDVWSWDFPENKPGGTWGEGERVMSVFWQGILQAGTRISVTSGNLSNVSNLTVKSAYLRASFDRSVSSNARG